MGAIPDNYNLVINSNHALILQLVENSGCRDNRKEISRQLVTSALLSQNLSRVKPFLVFTTWEWWEIALNNSYAGM
jgi:hypothetical protein